MNIPDEIVFDERPFGSRHQVVYRIGNDTFFVDYLIKQRDGGFYGEREQGIKQVYAKNIELPESTAKKRFLFL